MWGVYYGLLLLLEKFVLGRFLEKLPGVIRILYSMFFVMIGWVIFAFDDLAKGFSYIGALFGGHGQALFNQESIYLLYNNGVLLVLLILGATMLPKLTAEKWLACLKNTQWVCVLLKSVFYVGIFIISVAYLVDATYNPFLYFRF